jgi:hypothetical protein
MSVPAPSAAGSSSPPGRNTRKSGKKKVGQTGEDSVKLLYMRQHSTLIRKTPPAHHHHHHNHHSTANDMAEDADLDYDALVTKPVIVVQCRNKQRLLATAWSLWTKNTGVTHDYNPDLLAILSRPTPADQFRTELEIEVMWKWVLQHAHADPTGANLRSCRVAFIIVLCLIIAFSVPNRLNINPPSR